MAKLLKNGAFVLFSLFALFITVYGILHMLIWGLETNQCAMTYMYPNYHKIELEHSIFTNDPLVNKLSSKYSLYIYQEGRNSPKSQREIQEYIRSLEGIPVLFIPGNAGSAKQVRSIASECARIFDKTVKFVDSDNPSKVIQVSNQRSKNTINKFDFFAVDFNEELSAFSGSLLEDQTSFAISSIDFILSLYRNNSKIPIQNKPTSVLIVGHSMGGFVARALFLHPKYQSGSVQTILSLNSPQNSPVILTHRSTQDFYSKVNNFWRENAKKENSTLSDIVLISIAGGFRDTLVRSDFADVDSFVDEHHGFTIFSTSMENVWVSADHQCILWCNQVVKAISNALFDIIDPKTKQIFNFREDRLLSLKRNLLSTLPEYFGLESSKIQNLGITHSEIKNPKINLKELQEAPLEKQRRSKLTNLNKRLLKFTMNWRSSESFALLTNLKQEELTILISKENLESIIDITDRVVAVYSHNILLLKPEEVYGYDTLVISINSQTDKNFIIWDFLKLEDTKTIINDFPPMSLLGVYANQLKHKHSMISHLVLKNQNSLFPLQLYIEQACEKGNDYVPLIYQYTHSLREGIFKRNLTTILQFHQDVEEIKEDMHVYLFLDPFCEYQVSIFNDFIGMISQLLRHNLLRIISTCFVVLMFVLRRQLSPLAEGKQIPSFWSSLVDEFFTTGLASMCLSVILTETGLFPSISESTTYLKVWIFSVSYAISFSLLFIFSLIALIIFFAFSVFKFIRTSTISSVIGFIFLVIAAFISALSPAIGLLIGVFVLAASSSSDNLSLRRYQQSLFVVYMLCVALLVPSFIIFFKNLPLYEFKIDTAFFSTLTCLASIYNARRKIPVINHIAFVSLIFSVAAVVIVLYSMDALFLILEFLAGVNFALILLCNTPEQRIAPVSTKKLQ